MGNILFLIGSPRNGIHLLTNCLRILGCSAPARGIAADPMTITSLLFQELDLDPFMVGSLPEGWQYSKAADKAKKRIQSLILNCKHENNTFVIAAPGICRIMPIWIDSLRGTDIDPMFIHCLRHPWEISQSLAVNENMDLDKAHLLWLAYTRESMRVSNSLPHVIITFDQLLSDPVHSMQQIKSQLSIYNSKKLEEIYPEVTQFVQPDLKKYKADSLSQKEKLRFGIFRDLYSQILSFQQTPSCDYTPNNPLCENGNGAKHLQSNKKISLPIREFNEFSDDLLKTMYRVIGRYEIKEKKRQIGLSMGTVDDTYARHFFAKLEIFTQEKDEFDLEKFSLPVDQWFKMTVPIKIKDNFKEKQLIFIPLNTTGIVKISTIILKNIATEKSLWSAKTVQDFDNLDIKGHAIRLPHRENLLLFVTGHRPMIILPIFDDLPDCPIEISIWIKVSMVHEFLKEKEYYIFDRNDSSSSFFISKNKVLDSNKIDVTLRHIFPNFLGNTTETSMKYFLSNKEIMLKTKKYSKCCGFSLPTFLVSYPRSGSNFLQNVLRKSTDLYCCSFYAPRPKNPQCVFSFKSHALSPKYLNDEIKRYYPAMKIPEKIIWLKRDPRDVMISFYEFLKFKKKIVVEQSNFLNGIDYDYAFVGDSINVHSYLRKIDIAPLSIIDAYIRHVSSWLEIRDNTFDFLEVSYENLVENPNKFFKIIFNFLEVDVALNIKSLSKKVSLYSNESRKRSQAYGWKKSKTHSCLIEQVNDKLSKYISMLGY